MVFGVIIACMSPIDVSSCQVIFYDKERFSTMYECQYQMNEFAKYAATNYNLVTRPFCFQITDQPT